MKMNPEPRVTQPSLLANGLHFKRNWPGKVLYFDQVIGHVERNASGRWLAWALPDDVRIGVDFRTRTEAANRVLDVYRGSRP